MKTIALLTLFLVGCIGETSSIEGTGPDPTAPKTGATVAEGTTPPAPTTTATSSKPATPAPTSSAKPTTPPAPTPAPAPTVTPPPNESLVWGQGLLDRWCTQITQCETQGYPGYGPIAACEGELTLTGKWSCNNVTDWNACEGELNETQQCGSQLPEICLGCTGGQGAKLPP